MICILLLVGFIVAVGQMFRRAVHAVEPCAALLNSQQKKELNLSLVNEFHEDLFRKKMFWSKYFLGRKVK